MDDFDRYVFIELPEWLHGVLAEFADECDTTLDKVCVELLTETVRIAWRRGSDV